MVNGDNDLSNKLDWPASKFEDLFFEPRIKPVRVKGTSTGWKTIYREDEKEGNDGLHTLAVVGPNYMLLPNSRLNSIVSSFQDFELTLNMGLSGQRSDKKFNLVYNIRSGFDFGSDPSDGGKLQPKLVVRNSYDGSSQIELLFGLFRFICANLVVVPTQDRVIKFQARHHTVNSGIESMIHGFLAEALDASAFSDIREKILRSKMETDTKTLPLAFIKSLPFKLLFPVLGAIRSHSQVPVIVSGVENDRSYSLQSTAQTKALISEIVNERAVPGNEKHVDVESRWDEATAMIYPEEVNNHWQLFNLVLKTVQAVVEKERRIEMAREIGQHFLAA